MSAAFWNRIAELEARVGELTERVTALETPTPSEDELRAMGYEPIKARKPGRPRKLEVDAA